MKTLSNARWNRRFLKTDEAYVDYVWSVRRALECWENEKRLAAYQRRRECARAG